VVFSAHGVPKSVPAAAKARKCCLLDATCPLVSKVHVEAQRHFDAGREIVLIGQAGHPEVVGTMGQLPDGAVALIETVEDAQAFAPRDPANVAFVTQTTLSVDDTAEIVAALRGPLPGDRRAAQGRHLLRHHQPPGRGEGDRGAIARSCWCWAAPTRRTRCGWRRWVSAAAPGLLIDDADGLDFAWLEGARTVGVTAGASAPEVLVQGVLDRLATLCGDRRGGRRGARDGDLQAAAGGGLAFEAGEGLVVAAQEGAARGRARPRSRWRARPLAGLDVEPCRRDRHSGLRGPRPVRTTAIRSPIFSTFTKPWYPQDGASTLGSTTWLSIR
jgi:hypothetical protein